MTIAPIDLPLASLPFDPKALERDVLEMERTLDLLRRRDEAAAALKARGVEFTIDAMKPADIFAFVAARRGCSVEEIRGQARVHCISHARHEVFYLMSIQVRSDGSKRFSLPQIGRMVTATGAKPFDHTSVLHGIRRHAERLRAAAAGELPSYRDVGPRPRPARLVPGSPASVCMLPANDTCPGCGALAGEPCNDGARRG